MRKVNTKEAASGWFGKILPGIPAIPIIVSCWIPNAWGAESGGHAETPLTLSEVLDKVLRAYPIIVSAMADERAAQGEHMAARGGFDPLLRARGDGTPLGPYPGGRFDLSIEQPTPLYGASLFAGYRVSAGDFAEYDGKLVTNQYGEARLGIAIPLLRNGLTDRRRTTLRRAESSVLIAQNGVTEARLFALRLGGFRYLDWAGAGLRKQVVDALYELSQTRDAGLAERVRRGDLPAIERVDNQRALLQRQGLLISAQRSIENTSYELSLFYRDDAGKPIIPSEKRLPKQLPLPGRPEAFSENQVQQDQATALANRPEPKRLREQKKQLDWEIRWAKNQLWPSLDVAAQVSQDFGPPGYPRDKTQLDLSLQLDVPTLNRVARGRLIQAEAALQKLTAQERLVLDRIRTEVLDTHSLMAQAVARVRLAQTEYDLAKQVEEAERAKFALGDSTLLSLNLREQATFDAALRRIDALVEYHKAEVIYETVLGAR